VIFKKVLNERPYPEHNIRSTKDWANISPRHVKLSDLITTKSTLSLETLLSEDSTFYGDLFAHVVRYKGELYLESGLHRALRAALQQRLQMHVRVLSLDDDGNVIVPPQINRG
jgi:Arc/MetJ family transcription regulator